MYGELQNYLQIDKITVNMVKYEKKEDNSTELDNMFLFPMKIILFY